MFCRNCGQELQEADAFCSRCGKVAGAAAAPPPPPRASRRLVRLMDDKKIAGVCAGVAAYCGADVKLVRALWGVAALGTIFVPWLVVSILAYLVAWVALPKEYARRDGAGGIIATPTPGA